MTEATTDLRARAAAYVDELCLPYPDRHVGGPGGQAANDFFARTVAGFGFDVERISFDCLDWEYGGCEIAAGSDSFEALPGPYSLPFDDRLPLAAVSTVDELEELGADGASGAVLLLHGAIVAEQMTPKNYPFYRWDEHTRILAAIEAAAPRAIVAATARSSELVGAIYPFPFIEDGDFAIPSAYMTDVEGERLLPYAGSDITLRIDSRPVPTSAEQIVARLPGATGRRIVVTAHIDSREGTPGALDNATGVAVLLLVGELLGAARAPGGASDLPTVELVPFNGEDNYAAPGQVAYIASAGGFDDIDYNVNIDGAGWVGHLAEVSTYGAPPVLAERVASALARRSLVSEGAEWPQGDHMIFAMREIPAIAITTANASELRWEIAHTERDTPQQSDPDTVVEVARFVADVVGS